MKGEDRIVIYCIDANLVKWVCFLIGLAFYIVYYVRFLGFVLFSLYSLLFVSCFVRCVCFPTLVITILFFSSVEHPSKCNLEMNEHRSNDSLMKMQLLEWRS